MIMVERCSRCILPSSLPGVSLDENGVCNYCRSFEQRYIKPAKRSTSNVQETFERILESHKGKGMYDCLVPVSGGKDSMYALYVLSGVFKLNVLAFNMDNGFQSPKARENIERAVRRLGAELIIYMPSEDIMRTLYRAFLTRSGEFCTPCNTLIHTASERVARQHGIPLVVLGGAKKWSASILGMSISKYSNYPYYSNVLKGFMDTGKIRHYLPRSPMATIFKKVIGKGEVKDILLFEYYNPMKERVLETLERELGWEPPSEELEHGDCLLNPLKDYIVCRKWGYSEVTGGYSSQVRNGKMDREEALKKAEAEEVRRPPAVLEVFLEKTGITHNDFKESMKRHFTDYPNEYGTLYNISKRAYKMMRLK